MLPSRQVLQTGVGCVLLVCSLFAAGPLQLWKAENRAKLGALLGVQRLAPSAASLHASPPPPAQPVPAAAGLAAPPVAASTRLSAPPAACCRLATLARWGEPLTSRPTSEGVLLDYAFHHTAVAVVQVMRFPWEVVLTAPHVIQVHEVADPEDFTPAAAVLVLAVHAQGPYVAVWMPDPGVLMDPEAPQRVYRWQLTLPSGAVSRAADGREVGGTTHAFLVSAQHVAEDLAFLDLLTPGHLRVSGQKGEQPSGPEATRASFLISEGLDHDAPPTPLARIVARLAGHPPIPSGVFEDATLQEWEHHDQLPESMEYAWRSNVAKP